jgi:hypothetical protein
MPNDGGEVVTDPEDLSNLKYGATVLLTAVPNEGRSFIN